MTSADVGPILQSLSLQSCTPRTVQQVQRLLRKGPGDENGISTSSIRQRRAVASQSAASSGPILPAGRGPKRTQNDDVQPSTGTKATQSRLSSSQIKAASQIFNLGLKGLSAAPKSTPVPHAKDASGGKATSTKPKGALKDSSRVADGLRSLAECTCIAIAALLSQQKTRSKELKLENGTLALVHHLFNHGLLDLGKAQLCSLYSVLIPGNLNSPYSHILNLEKLQDSDEEFNIFLANYELQVLRGSRDGSETSTLSAFMPYLGPDIATSPESLVASLLSSSTARATQLAHSLSQVIASLAATVLSLDGLLALELQVIALRLKAITANDGADIGDAWKTLAVCLSKLPKTPDMSGREWRRIKFANASFQQKFDSAPPEELQQRYRPDVLRHLAGLAMACGYPDEALHLNAQLDVACPAEDNTSLTACSRKAREASLALHSLMKGKPTAALVSALTEAGVALKRPLDGTAKDFSSALKDVMQLRKVTVDFIQDEPEQRTSDRIRTSALDVLAALATFFLHYLGRAPAEPDSPRDDEYQTRLDVVSRPMKTVVESILFAFRKTQAPVSAEFKTLFDMLHGSFSVIDRLRDDATSGYQLTDIRLDNLDKLLVTVSNAYWTTATKHEERFTPSQCKTLMKQSCAVISHLDAATVSAAGLCLKHYRLGKSCQKLGLVDEARESFVGAIKSGIKTGILKKAAEIAGQGPLSAAANDQDCRVSIAAFKGIFDVSDDAHKKESFFDDVSLSSEDRSTLFEWQLDIMNARGQLSSAAAVVLARTVTSLIDLGLPRLRSARILFRILHVIGSSVTGEQYEGLIAMSVKVAHNLADEQHGEETSGVIKYQRHVAATLFAELGLVIPSQTADFFLKAINIWSQTTDGGTDKDSIDDIDIWISQLKCIAAYWDLKGLEGNKICTLSVLDRACKLKSREHLDVQLSISHQLLQMGFYEKALARLEQLVSDREMTKCQQARSQSLKALCVAACRPTVNLDRAGNDLLALLDEFEAQTSATEEALMATCEICQALTQISLVVGKAPSALLFAWKRVHTMQRLWRATAPTQPNNGQSSTMEPDEEYGQDQERIRDDVQVIRQGARYWSILPRLIAALLELSELSKRYGFVQDAQSVTSQALKVARDARSGLFLHLSLAEQGDSESRTGDVVHGRARFAEAMSGVASLAPSRHIFEMNELFAYSLRLARDWPAESSAHDRSAAILTAISDTALLNKHFVSSAETSELATRLAGLSLDAEKANASAAKPRNGMKGHKKTVSVAQRSKTPLLHAQEAMKAASFHVREVELARRRADSLVAQGELESAWQTLKDLDVSDGDAESVALTAATLGGYWLAQALEAMTIDSVHSVLAESAISVPSLDLSASSEYVSGRQARKASHTTGPASQADKSFSALLEKANSHLARVLDWVPTKCSNYTVSRISALFATSIFLESAVTSKPDVQVSPDEIARSIELARDVAARREEDAIIAAGLSKSANIPDSSCAAATESDTALDLPEGWTAVSVTLAEDKSHLLLVRYTARSSPFVLRLPLRRQHAEEAMEDEFTFEDAETEVRAIIAESDSTIERARGGEPNESSKARSKSDQADWWAEREALDGRLRDLLLHIESHWLGGFRGMLRPDIVDEEALKSFIEDFLIMLDQHLPSRKSPKASSKGKVAIHDKVFELFALLGGADDSGVDLDEALTDLLYFIVDILQFSGERNAYDEIDFDSMIIETADALKRYHNSERNDGSVRRHLILILDKQLHAIPWESMPCLESHSVSRLPSLHDLRTRLAQMKQQGEQAPPGIRISSTRGTYMLNPSCDLPKTQQRFESAFASSRTTKTWPRQVGSAPDETAFSKALTWRSDDALPPLLVYVGHGSGAQYIRGKTVRRLHPRCGAALLFGCSSAALRHAGEFQPLGVPKNYMVARAPAMLGALWDVTDGDCDAFTAGVLRRWGVLDADVKIDLPRRKRKKGENVAKMKKQSAAKGTSDTRMSLDEAVAASRGECYLKYLNGAAMVVYGIPCFLSE